MPIKTPCFRTLVVVVVAVLLTGGVKGQHPLSQKDFDSLYSKAMANLTADIRISYQCLDALAATGEPLTELRRARIGYLRMQVYDADSAGKGIPEESQIHAPGQLNLKDSLMFHARRYLERSMPDMAIPLLMKALEVLPGSSDDANRARIELSEAYRQKVEYRKGIRLIMDLLEQPAQLSDPTRAYAFNRLAALYNESGSPAGSYTDSVFKYSMLCLGLAEKTGDKPALAAAQNELSFQYRRRKEYHRALELSKQAVSNFLASAMPFQAMNALINQSSIYQKTGDFKAAFGSLETATSLAPIWENRNLYMRIYLQYSNLYTATDNYRDAYEFLQLYLLLQKEFFRDRMNIQIVEQSARYDLFVKEQTIREAQKKNEFNRRQLILLAILTAAITLAFVVTYFYFRLSRKGALTQKLAEAVLETETNERRRIARDLHDGLGPLLSAINHYFQAFLDAKPENRESIQTRLQTVISEAIDEVSRISHNISPHVLEKHGLLAALNNLMAPLTAQGKFDVAFTSGLDRKLEPKTELTVYRCISELLNNTMKHAEATRITLDIRITGSQLMIRYSDNGKGFDTAQARKTGMGLHNISNRVESSGGILSMESPPNSGILVSITIPV